MTSGINTSKRNLDDPYIDWSNFDIWLLDWPSLSFPEFGGRYFLGGRFEQTDPLYSDIKCVANWSCGELLNSPLHVTMNYVVPIQAGIKTRSELKGKKGRLAGRIDAKRFCERIKAAIAIGDFVMPLYSKSIYVFLEVEEGTTLTKYYWQAWAAEIVSFIMIEGASNIVRPFLPCIMCNFENDATSGKYVPSVSDVQTCLTQNLIRDGKSYKQCHAFWAITKDEIVLPGDFPEIGMDIFGDFSQQYDTHRTVIPVVFWQFATADESDWTIAGLNLSVAHNSINLVDCTLGSAGWDVIDTPTVFGIDTAIPTIATPEITDPPTSANAATTNRISCIKTKEIPDLGGTAVPKPISFVGRYYKQNENVRGKKRLTGNEMKALTKGGLNIISIFQANTRTINGVDYDIGWCYPEDHPLEFQIFADKYFAHGFDIGVLDGYDACIIADGLRGLHQYCKDLDQPDRTVIYFATDYHPAWRYEQPEPADAATVEQRLSDLEEYFKGVAAGFIRYQMEGGSRYYDIGLYAVKLVCDRLYPLGIFSHFWQLGYYVDEPNFRHANMIQSDLNQLFVECTPNENPRLDVDYNIAWGAEGSWNSKTEFIKP